MDNAMPNTPRTRVYDFDIYRKEDGRRYAISPFTGREHDYDALIEERGPEYKNGPLQQAFEGYEPHVSQHHI